VSFLLLPETWGWGATCKWWMGSKVAIY